MTAAPIAKLTSDSEVLSSMLPFIKELLLVYTARDSRIGSGSVGQPLNLNPPASINFLSLSATAYPENEAFSGTPSQRLRLCLA
jgi:hypothetical protein